MARVVEDIDKGWDNIQRELSKLKDSYVLIGIQEGTVTKEEVKGDRLKKGGQSMVDIAVANEFGTKIIPARPFMSTSYDENKALINKAIITEYRKVQDGKLNGKKALTRVGLLVVRLIQQKINQIKTPPNAPSTIQRKGSSNPLIDFGQMINSVREKVVM